MSGSTAPVREAAQTGVPALVKRSIDLAGACILLALSSPVLAVVAVAIKTSSRGPILYRQGRVGRDGRPFEILKLRTMVVGAEGMGAGHAVNVGDPRITRSGAAIRRLSLDELPNLINVLKGEMSLVGPRPTLQYQVDEYTERQRFRLSVKPGITGWAQVKGRAALPWDERIELDIWYVENWSVRLDLRIFLMTLKLMATGKGLYKGESGGWRNEL